MEVIPNGNGWFLIENAPQGDEISQSIPRRPKYFDKLVNVKMREASFYHDAPFKYSENDQDDWKTFPVSFVHIVELTSEAGLAMYGLRMRYFNGNLAMICSPVSDLSLMHDRVEYERFVIAMGYTLMKREVRENMFSVQRHIRRERENAYVTALAAEGSATDVAEEPVDEAASCNPPHRP